MIKYERVLLLATIVRMQKTKPISYWSCNLPRYAKQLGLSGGVITFLVKPYTQTYDNGVIIRQFDEDVNDDELI